MTTPTGPVPVAPPSGSLPPHDREALERAWRVLEHPSLVARISSAVGSPIEEMVRKLPGPLRSSIDSISRTALEKALAVAVNSLDAIPLLPASPRFHTGAVCLTGGIGGAFGMGGLAIELPLSTTVILRSIAGIARHHGEDLSSHHSRLGCLEVFALGGRSPEDDSSESAYLAVRTALARSVSEAARHLARAGVLDGGPALVRLISQISSRFSIVVSQKAAAQMVPLIGAIGGAALNLLFIEHYHSIADAHFTIRRLERSHGTALVHEAYRALGAGSGS